MKLLMQVGRWWAHRKVVLWGQEGSEKRDEFLMRDVWERVVVDDGLDVRIIWILCISLYRVYIRARELTNALACNTQALGTPTSFQILQKCVLTPSLSNSRIIILPSSLSPSGATSTDSTTGNWANIERIYPFKNS